MAGTSRSVRSSVGRDAWRDPAVRHVLAHLALPHDRLVRIVDVRAMGPDEVWVEANGRHIVAGLRRESCAAGAVGAGDGWFRLLYLYETEPVAVRTVPPVLEGTV